ncbi:MAG: DUF3373 domain-containing protein [Proteobacteria bacterium]|nr:DUF3373 domain-containing protein [Pseudomonadota bacterium]MBU1420295.1 DUF3373 domain-containing protein [Pseudomonadota bacterium]MBU1455624.1 DUF3373 domain-containing protein [Pseudomonadota bacterium]
MVKKFSMLALAGLIALPAVASASGGANAGDLERKIEELSLQLDQLKAQMSEKGEGVSQSDFNALSDTVGSMEERSDSWDLAARINFYGDFRARLDYYRAKTVSESIQRSDTLWTNRFRLNMRVKATENVEFKARLAMYKAWGMETTPNGIGGGYPMWDGNSTRQPSDNALRVDRAFVNWNNIAGVPLWFSIGRRPTTDGPPAQVRMGTDERMATPVAFMDWPFDGISMGYAYRWGVDALGTGRVRFCYGRGFEDGLEVQDGTEGIMDDMDFAGLSWDVMKKGDRFLNLQSFMAFNVFNYPSFESDFINAFAPAVYGQQTELGNIMHTSGVYMDKIGDVSFFAAGGWSQTDPNDNGMFNDYIGMMMGGTTNSDKENGYSVYLGARYDIDSIGLKLGAEWNYGSEYWIAMSPGHDDMYLSKLAARGNVFEVYGIYDLPTGEAISKYAKTFVRFGYQRYEYDYSGSMDWNMKPYDLGDAMDQQYLSMLGQDPVESADQVYLTFEAFF